LGVRWHQQHIVEGERFAEKAHVKAPKNRLYSWALCCPPDGFFNRR